MKNTSNNTPRKPRKCACNCGQMTQGGIFRQGHDSILKSKLVKRIRKGGVRGEQAKVRMKELNWDIPVIRELAGV